MSDSVRPHRQQPTRLLSPWDSPGKNTGVGCHFLLQCMKVKSESEVAQSCPTLRDPMDCSPAGSSVHGFSRQEYWSGVPFPSPEQQQITKNKRICPLWFFFSTSAMGCTSTVKTSTSFEDLNLKVQRHSLSSSSEILAPCAVTF